MAFTDGASIENPGKAGAGVSFYGVERANSLKSLENSSGSEASEMSYDEKEPSLKSLANEEPFDNIEGCRNPRLKHLFSC